MPPSPEFHPGPRTNSPGLLASPEPTPPGQAPPCATSLKLGGVTPTKLMALDSGEVVLQGKIKMLGAEAQDMGAGLMSTADVPCHLHPLFPLSFSYSK